MPDEDIEICDNCGASIYPEHIESGKAASMGGKLRCPHCLAEYKATHHTDAPRVVGQTTMRAPGEGDKFEAITMAEDAGSSMSSTQIRAVGGETAEMAAQQDDSEFSRALSSAGGLATRCRTFHARLNDGAIMFMNRQMNEWVDANPDLTIKFAASTVGVFEGKKSEPTLIVTVFY